MSSQVIDTAGGASQPTLPVTVTDTTGSDITAQPFQLAYLPPSAETTEGASWVNPIDPSTSESTVAAYRRDNPGYRFPDGTLDTMTLYSVTGKLPGDATTRDTLGGPGQYRVWYKIGTVIKPSNLFVTFT